jgi:hypothetical protein
MSIFPRYYPIAPHLTATDPNAGIVYVLARRNLTNNMFLVAMDVHTGALLRNERIKDIIDPGDEIGLEVSLNPLVLQPIFWQVYIWWWYGGV